LFGFPTYATQAKESTIPTHEGHETHETDEGKYKVGPKPRGVGFF